MLPSPPADPIAAVTHPDPYAYYAALRRVAQVHRDARLGLWVVVGSEAIRQALSDARGRVRPSAEPVPRFLLGAPAGAVFAALARMNDAPVHGPQRERVDALLRRLAPQRLATDAQRAAQTLAQGGLLQGDAHALDRFAQTLPATVMAAALGLPEADWPAIVQATAEWVAALSPLADDSARAQGIAAMDRLLGALAALGIADVDAAAAQVALLMQPHDATAGLIGAGVLRLALDPALRTAALDGSLPWEAFGAEVLRHDPPVHNTRRTLAADMQIGGVPMRAGDTLLIVLAAAERDPARHDAPDRFRLDRAPLASLVLGAGAHVCPGAAIGLTIAQAGWRALLSGASAPALAALAGRVRWRASVNARLPFFGQGAPRSP